MSNNTVDDTQPEGDNICWEDAHQNAACALGYRLLDRKFIFKVFTTWPNAVYLVWIVLVLFLGKLGFWAQLSMHYRFSEKKVTEKDMFVEPPLPMYDTSMAPSVKAGEKKKSKKSKKEETLKGKEEESYSSYYGSELQEDSDTESKSSDDHLDKSTIEYGGDDDDDDGDKGDNGRAGDRRPDDDEEAQIKNCTGFSLSYHLVHKDNKAIAICFSAYLFALGLVVEASMLSLTRDFVENVWSCLMWSAIGFVLLLLSNAINNVAVNGSAANTLAIMWGMNVPMAIVEGASYVSSGMIVAAAVAGPSVEIGEDIASTALFFALGQFFFVAYARLYLCVAPVDLQKELRGEGVRPRRNLAAAVSFALDQITIALLLSNASYKSGSLVTYFIWAGICLVIMPIARLMISFMVMGRTASFVEEVGNDQNWGIALLQGGMQLTFAAGLNSFLPFVCTSLDRALQQRDLAENP